MVRRTMVGAAALMAVGSILGCGGQESATGGISPASSAPHSRTAVGKLGDSSSAPARLIARTIIARVRNGQASGETGRVTVPLGTPITLSISSDVADEIHVHGYDRKAEISAGGTASVNFSANIPGVFEAELEESKLQLLQLEVS